MNRQRQCQWVELPNRLNLATKLLGTSDGNKESTTWSGIRLEFMTGPFGGPLVETHVEIA